jgi:hypothetical protein
MLSESPIQQLSLFAHDRGLILSLALIGANHARVVLGATHVHKLLVLTQALIIKACVSRPRVSGGFIIIAMHTGKL